MSFVHHQYRSNTHNNSIFHRCRRAFSFYQDRWHFHLLYCPFCESKKKNIKQKKEGKIIVNRNLLLSVSVLKTSEELLLLITGSAIVCICISCCSVSGSKFNHLVRIPLYFSINGYLFRSDSGMTAILRSGFSTIRLHCAYCPKPLHLYKKFLNIGRALHWLHWLHLFDKAPKRITSVTCKSFWKELCLSFKYLFNPDFAFKMIEKYIPHFDHMERLGNFVAIFLSNALVLC